MLLTSSTHQLVYSELQNNSHSCWPYRCTVNYLYMQKYDQSLDPTQPGLLDFIVREVHCDAPAETEWEKLAQNLQLKVGLQPPPPKVGNWTGFAKKYYWVQSHTYTKIWWSSVLKLQWVQLKVGLQLNPPPTPESRKLDLIHKEKNFIFFTQKINWKKKILSPGKSVCWHWSQPI